MRTIDADSLFKRVSCEMDCGKMYLPIDFQEIIIDEPTVDAEPVRHETMLRAQEPHVMALDEIGNALKMPLWKETKSAHKGLYTGWVLAYDIQKGEGITGTRLGMSEPSGRVVWYRLDDYGKTWRCWTTRPTDEQRKAVAWDAAD